MGEVIKFNKKVELEPEYEALWEDEEVITIINPAEPRFEFEEEE